MILENLNPPFSVTSLQSDLFTLTPPPPSHIHQTTPVPLAILFYIFKFIIYMADVHISVVINIIIVYYWSIRQKQ